MGDTFIVSKLANALVQDAEPIGVAAHNDAVAGAVERFREEHGGVWVGGRVTLTADTLSFRANGINRALQEGSLDHTITLASISDVEELGGFVSQKIRITHPGPSFTFRCFGAWRVARQIREAAAARTG
jgi:hypothetical protein